MLGSLLRLSLLGTLVGGSTVAMVGPDRLAMYLESGKETVLSAIDDAQGMESKLSLIRSQIRGLDDEVKDLKSEAIRRNVEVERLREEIAEREADVERKAAILEKVRGMLAEGKDVYKIRHVVYTRDMIEVDAAEKLALLNVQAETLNSLRETLATKEKAQAISEQNVARAAALRIDLSSKVSLLEARLQKFRAKQHFAATAAEIMDTDELDSDLAKAREMIASFEEDLEVKVRMLEQQLIQGGDQPAEGINYDELEQAEEGLVGRIDDVLIRVRGGDDYTVAIDVPTVH